MKKKRTKLNEVEAFSAAVGRALIRASKKAREIARMHGTPVYIVRNGKIVAEKP